MLQCGLLRSNFAFAITCLSSSLVCLGGSCRRYSKLFSGLAKIWPEDGAGEGNRTLVISLEGCCSTIELHPPGLRFLRLLHARRCRYWWGRLDSNQRS